MKIRNILFTTALIIFSGALMAQTKVEVQSVDMTIAGTSTLHDWTSSVNEVYAEGKVTLDGNQLQGINNLVVTIPVTSIKSDKGSNTMDNKTYKALESDDHPNIVYLLKKVNSMKPANGGYQLDTQGELKIAGGSELINMTVNATVLGNGDIRFEGSKDLKMTDFGIDPPSALLGTIKTGDEITINFTVTLSTTKS